MTVAKNIIEHRKAKPFTKREELLKVPKLGPKAYEQAAGFLRIPECEDVLENTGVHPESYEAADKLIKKFNYSNEDIKGGKLQEIGSQISTYGTGNLATELGIGEPTLLDIVKEIQKPGRDIRDSLPPPVLRADLMDMKDLTEGMELTGTVRNVIDFGAFVDIGVHHDGLLHLSQISDKFIKHPSEVLRVGQVVKVRVLGVDNDKKRINLSMRTPGLEKPPKREPGEKREFNRDRQDNYRSVGRARPSRNGESADRPKREFSRERGERLPRPPSVADADRERRVVKPVEGVTNASNASTVQEASKPHIRGYRPEEQGVTAANNERPPRREFNRDRQSGDTKREFNNDRTGGRPRPPFNQGSRESRDWHDNTGNQKQQSLDSSMSLEDQLKALSNKFGKK